MLNKFAVVRQWHDLSESISSEGAWTTRVGIAANNLGIECVEIDPAGYCVKTGVRVRNGDVDFSLDSYLGMPKAYDIFAFSTLMVSSRVASHSVIALLKVLSYNHVLASHTRMDDYVSALFTACAEPLHLNPEILMPASVQDWTIAPVAKKRSLFYIGLNWEIAGGSKVRGKSLLKDLDASGNLAIYGPLALHGVKVWDGYQSYVGSLPFDEMSVVRKMADHGAVLSISHPLDLVTGLATTRIFEAAAAGAVIISDENRMVRDLFGDRALYFENDSPAAFEQVMGHLDWMNTHQSQAAEMTREVQEIFRKELSLEEAIKRIYAALPERKKQLQFGLDPAAADNPKVRLYYILSDDSEQSVDFCLRSCCDQDYRNRDLVVVMDSSQDSGKIESALQESSVAYDLRYVANLRSMVEGAMGQVLAQILAPDRDGDFECFSVATSGEWLYSDHLSSLMRIRRGQLGSVVAAVSEVTRGKLPEPPGLSTNGAYMVHSSESIQEEMVRPGGFGRFLLPRSAITDMALEHLPSLGRRAMLMLVGEQPIKTSFLATVLSDRTVAFFDRDEKRDMENKLLATCYDSAGLQSASLDWQGFMQQVSNKHWGSSPFRRAEKAREARQKREAREKEERETREREERAREERARRAEQEKENLQRALLHKRRRSRKRRRQRLVVLIVFTGVLATYLNLLSG